MLTTNAFYFFVSKVTEKAVLKEIKEENSIDETIESVISEFNMVDTGISETTATEEDQSVRKSQRKCVRFAESTPSMIAYLDDTSDTSDTSDNSWHEDEPKLKKKAKAPKKKVLKKPVKRLQPKTKSILKPDKNRDPIDETIESVIIKYCGVRDAVSVAKKMACINKRKAIQEMYESKLAEYSAVKKLASSRERCSGFFKDTVERKSLFECICGAEDMDDGQVRVKCSQCSVWQHASCVRFSKNSRLQYFCPHCWQLQPVVPSRATLIVAPASISQQWMDEIKKLIVKKGIKVEFYR